MLMPIYAALRVQVWFARQYKAYQPNTLLLDNALATMGAGGGTCPAVCRNGKPMKVVEAVSVSKLIGLPACPVADLRSCACIWRSIPEVKSSAEPTA